LGIAAGQLDRQGADNPPPVADGRAGQGLQHLDQAGVGGPAGVKEGDDGGTAEQLEGRLPQVVSCVMALLGGLAIASPVIQLSQGQGQPRQQVVIKGKVEVHGSSHKPSKQDIASKACLGGAAAGVWAAPPRWPVDAQDWMTGRRL
jgi:hypothetical protein